MKEITFIRLNKKRWSDFEDQISGKDVRNISPDDLASNYIRLTDDLSYARTFYPQSGVVEYLNTLSSKAHALIYRNKRERSDRLTGFWLRELPLEIYNIRKDILLSFLIFMGAFLIGWFSAFQEEYFVRAILGNEYVNTTIDNISKGDPLGIYGDSTPFRMFLAIAFNNIRVSIVAFIFGLLTPIGTAVILMRNGIMVGAFLSFFFQYSLGKVSIMGVMLHGTMELSAIVLAGGAGLMLGRSILFPGTYTRTHQFINAARRGTKLVVGIMPCFVIAAIIESYVTRYYKEMGFWAEFGIILISLLFMVFYFIIYPIITHNKYEKPK